MTEVMIKVSYYRPVGAFMTALARAPETARPATVEAFLQQLAAYLNRYLLDAANPLDKTRPSPSLDGAGTGGPGQVKAEFLPDTAGDAAPDAIGSWRVQPYLEIAHVKRNAALDLLNHSADRVRIRLPEAGLLAEAENEAAVLSQSGDGDRMTGPAYYYDYIGGATGNPITTMEYFWSRIADYTTASCR